MARRKDHRAAMDQKPHTLSSPMLGALATLLLATTALADPPTLKIHDLAPTVSIADARIKEGNSGDVHLSFPVRLTGPTGALVTVDFTTIEGPPRSRTRTSMG